LNFMLRDILAWALATELMGLAVLPLLRGFFANRRDAALLSRPVGLAAVAWVAWALSLLTRLGFQRITMLVALGLVAAAALLARPRAAPESPMRAPWWGDEEKLAAVVFWAPALVFLLIRAAGPAILGAEKFMDLAFLNSLARFPGMPPADPWMAGKTINYYYWGYLLAAAQAQLSGVAPLVAFNLSIATFAASSFAAAACLGLRLSRGRLGVGLWSGFGAVFAGNLTGAFDAWSAPFARDFDYWHASRVIGPPDFKTINEFPFFTFFHADLHPHLLAFPFFIAAFVVAHRWVEDGAVRAFRAWPGMLLLALVAGTARAANFWNLPAMAILLVVGGVFGATRGARMPTALQALKGGGLGVVVLVASLVLFFPYTASFALAERGLGAATMFSEILEFLGVWGILVAAALLGLWPRPSDDSERSRRWRDFGVAVAAAASLVCGFGLRRPALAIVLFLSLLALGAAWKSLRAAEDDGAGVFAAFLVLLALGMIGGCEFVYFKDTYGQDLQRMNTIFKFYHQAWPLLAIGSVVFVGRAVEAGTGRRLSFRAALAVLALLALMWPANVVVSRFRQKDGPFSLDAHGPLVRRNEGDAAVIDWLIKNAPQGSVLLEASGDPYSEYARISSHTGIPTVLGWANHEGLWRATATAEDPQVAERLGQIKLFYTTPDPNVASQILQRYRVTHVILGDMERRTYGSNPAIEGFSFLFPVFQKGGTTVYAVARPR
jgi:YYY domain-containing protein